MIVPITGNVAYNITLDPTVWIFDERKVLLEEAFLDKSNTDHAEDEFKEVSERWERAIHPDKQTIYEPVNKGISRNEREKILQSTYVMPIKEFIDKAEIKDNAKEAVLITNSGEQTITLDELTNSYFLFAVEGKPLREDGPVYLLFRDGSNKDNPIKGIQKIIIK